MKTVAKAGIILAVLVALTGCEQWIDRFLDAHSGDDTSIVQPDSIRGNTTYYSYSLRVTPMPGWTKDDGDVVLASVAGGVWLIHTPHYDSLNAYFLNNPTPVANHFRLICKSGDSTETVEIRRRAFAAIERAGAQIKFHITGQQDLEEQSVDYYGMEMSAIPSGLGSDTEFFDVYHPACEYTFDTPHGIPSDVPLLEFITALDDTSAFEYVFPFMPQWVLLRQGR